jgi:hypothetical protein
MTWFIALGGPKPDLEDWEDCLRAPFDPNVRVVHLPDGKGGTTATYVLNAPEFASCAEASEVREIAIPLIRRLNSLVAVHMGSDPVRLSAVLQQQPDGTYRSHTFGELNTTLGRIKMKATGTLSGGKPAPPQPSLVQRALTSKHSEFLDALEHYSRANNWHDLYKVFEAISEYVSGRQRIPRSLGVASREVSDFYKSAQIARHHKYRGEPPTHLFSLTEGRQFIAFLLRACMDKESK